MRSSKEAFIGDTFHKNGEPVTALPGFQPLKPMVFAGVYPLDQSQHVELRNAIDKLTLNDSAVTVTIDSRLIPSVSSFAIFYLTIVSQFSSGTRLEAGVSGVVAPRGFHAETAAGVRYRSDTYGTFRDVQIEDETNETERQRWNRCYLH